MDHLHNMDHERPGETEHLNPPECHHRRLVALQAQLQILTNRAITPRGTGTAGVFLALCCLVLSLYPQAILAEPKENQAARTLSPTDTALLARLPGSTLFKTRAHGKTFEMAVRSNKIVEPLPTGKTTAIEKTKYIQAGNTYELIANNDKKHPRIVAWASGDTVKATFHNEHGSKFSEYTTGGKSIARSENSLLSATFSPNKPEKATTATPVKNTLEPTATATATVEPTPTPTTLAEPTPTPLSGLQSPQAQKCLKETLYWPTESLTQTLNDWKDGKIHVDLAHRFTEAGKYDIFGYSGMFKDPTTIKGFAETTIIGTLLGSKMLDNHLIAYLGFEDINCNQYYIAFNLGDMSDPRLKTIAINKLPDSELADDTISATVIRFTHPAYVSEIQQLSQEQTIVLTEFPITKGNLQDDKNPADQRGLQELFKQLPLADQLNNFMNEVTYYKSLSEVQVPSVINQDPQVFDATQIPLAGSLYYWNQK